MANSLGGVNDDEHKIKGGFRAGGFRVEIYIPKVALFAEVQSRPLPISSMPLPKL